ncbi:5-formyltetrahydrofolate cyclo-ligase [Paramaledivibacter caminithermalis]|uniref:5-formyltetrahydrofolate cyclo-ligase n=1 Tax=Paramaledivibacter caminithermalis (strain DSM 15212 / CIP 107654 / DViRD3) TaxID=1121301 RepID=A0A1M6Q1A5_PARC5|nr:5-formyltetrahydrofolate cyclo-ligase [Paramaledivibacter caminithermalis]SHK14009.1 5-formyltetrahydrofolate cyclo-ligase [Paramaledivibacter caminithermalis DSM 15212]
MKTNTKKVLRKSMLIQRKEMKDEDVEKHSKEIISKLTDLEVFKESSNIMIYLSFRNEVDTYKLMDYCLNVGKKVIVPFCIEEERKIIPSEIKNPENELILNHFGYKEPDSSHLREVKIEDIDLVIVPGVVFDKQGNRIGFGGGYYDRFLKKLKDTTMTIAICYDYQIVERVPVNEFDMPVKSIITEKRIIRTSMV